MVGLTRRGWILAVTLGAAHRAFAEPDHFVVVVHKDNPARSLDREFLRDAYLKKATDWSHGETIRPVDLSIHFEVRGLFTREVLRKTPSQLRSYWNQQIFSGKGTPPVEAGSINEMLEYVASNAGAIGYLPAGASPARVKVIEVK